MPGWTMLLIGRIWTLGLWIKKAVELLKQGLIGHPKKSVEDSVQGDLNYGYPAQEVSK